MRTTAAWSPSQVPTAEGGDAWDAPRCHQPEKAPDRAARRAQVGSATAEQEWMAGTQLLAEAQEARDGQSVRDEAETDRPPEGALGRGASSHRGCGATPPGHPFQPLAAG